MKRSLLAASALLAAGVILSLLFVIRGELPAAKPAAKPATMPLQTTGAGTAAVPFSAQAPTDIEPMPLPLRIRNHDEARVTSPAPASPDAAPAAIPRIVTSPGISPGPSTANMAKHE